MKLFFNRYASAGLLSVFLLFSCGRLGEDFLSETGRLNIAFAEGGELVTKSYINVPDTSEFILSVMDNKGGTDYYIVSNEIRQSPGTTTIKGFRAFFKTPMVNEAKAMSLFPDGEDATAIEGVMAGGDFVAFPTDVYTVSGQLVRKNANGLGGLPRGMYIVGGHKVVVR